MAARGWHLVREQVARFRSGLGDADTNGCRPRVKVQRAARRPGSRQDVCARRTADHQPLEKVFLQKLRPEVLRRIHELKVKYGTARSLHRQTLEVLHNLHHRLGIKPAIAQ